MSVRYKMNKKKQKGKQKKEKQKVIERRQGHYLSYVRESIDGYIVIADRIISLRVELGTHTNPILMLLRSSRE